MYERAGGRGDGLGPLWHVEGGSTFFAGPLTYNAPHQHGAPVYLAGLYGSFRIRMGGEAWTTCRTALVRAGVLHELDCGGDPLAVLYREPDGAGRDAFASLMQGARDVDGALVGTGGEIRPLRELYERRDAGRWVGAALTDLSRFTARHADRAADPRIKAVLARLCERQDAGMSAGRLAAAVGLSPSRLQHLFTDEVGVAFRRYRAWMRMRRAIAAVAAGENFAGAAYAAGFADQAHFARDFRKTFGAPASRSLLNIRR